MHPDRTHFYLITAEGVCSAVIQQCSETNAIGVLHRVALNTRNRNFQMCWNVVTITVCVCVCVLPPQVDLRERGET